MSGRSLNVLNLGGLFRLYGRNTPLSGISNNGSPSLFHQQSCRPREHLLDTLEKIDLGVLGTYTDIAVQSNEKVDKGHSSLKGYASWGAGKGGTDIIVPLYKLARGALPTY